MEVICSAFWKHTNLRSDDRVFPCCRYKTPIQKFNGDLTDVLHSKEYQQLRANNLNGQVDPNCQKCYYEEQLGKKSLRQQFNEEFTTESVSLEFLEIGFDNICNLTCDGCWEEFSSAWARKKNTIQIKSTTDINYIPDSISKILLLGGEPLMTTRHIKFLNKVPNPSKVSVTYNTNGTFMLDQTAIDLLKKFSTVEFIVSIDGVGSLNEQVRSGSRWEDIVKFIQQIKQLDFKLSVNSVLHLNNWFGFKDLALFIEQNKLPWTVNFLTYPQALDVNNAEDLLSVKSFIQSIDNLPNQQAIVAHIKC